jgi:predicted dinucleotide-binding enzyme
VVLGDDPEAVETLRGIVTDIPKLRAFDGGSLANAVGMETFAAVLLTINVKNKARASLRLTGV